MHRNSRSLRLGCAGMRVCILFGACLGVGCPVYGARWTHAYPAQLLPPFALSLLVTGIVLQCFVVALRAVVHVLRTKRLAGTDDRARAMADREKSTPATALEVFAGTFSETLLGATDVLIGGFFTLFYYTCATAAVVSLAGLRVDSLSLPSRYMITMSRALEVLKCTLDPVSGRYTLDVSVRPKPPPPHRARTTCAP